MKTASALTILAAGLLLGAGDSQDAGKQIRELHQARIAVLQQAVDLLISEQKNARRTYDEVLHGRLQLLEAQRDAAETDEARVKFQASIVELLKERVTVVENLRERAIRGTLDVLNAKAERIKAEIELVELKARGGKPLQK